jgi:hypothetical protein
MSCEKCQSGTWTGFIDGFDCPGCGRSSRIGPDEGPLILPPEPTPEEIKRVRQWLGLDPTTQAPSPVEARDQACFGTE